MTKFIYGKFRINIGWIIFIFALIVFVGFTIVYLNSGRVYRFVCGKYELRYLSDLCSNPAKENIFFIARAKIERRKITSIYSFDYPRKKLELLLRSRYRYYNISDLSLSPNGEHIIFISDKTPPASPCIWIMTNTGTKRHQITKHDKDTKDKFPRWSSDGNKIAFLRMIVSERSDPDYTKFLLAGEVWITDIKSYKEKKLINGYITKYAWDWSGDGQKIYLAQNGDIKGVEVISGKARQLTKEKQVDYLRTSPDGKKILFLSRSSATEDAKYCIPGQGRGYRYNLWIMNVDGRGLKRLLTNENIWFPIWSPSNKEIIFHKIDSDNNMHICLFNLENNQYDQLTFGEVQDLFPVWLTDGTQVAFIRNSNTIWTMNIDGTNQHQIFPKP